jgi:hypothetical protein
MPLSQSAAERGSALTRVLVSVRVRPSDLSRRNSSLRGLTFRASPARDLRFMSPCIAGHAGGAQFLRDRGDVWSLGERSGEFGLLRLGVDPRGCSVHRQSSVVQLCIGRVWAHSRCLCRRSDGATSVDPVEEVLLLFRTVLGSRHRLHLQ